MKKKSQVMLSFNVIVRICQLEKVMSTEASPWCTSLSQVYRSLGGHHFLRLTNTDVYRKRMHQLFCYMTLDCIF